jgi:hypothetical protein
MPEVSKVSIVSVNGLAVPAVDGKPMCSSRDPEREATQWLASIANLIQPKSTVLDLGLGAGFHVKALLQKFPSTLVEVLELNPEVAAIDPQFAELICSSCENWSEINTQRIILEFRPAWIGFESQYAQIQAELLHQTSHAFRTAAQKAGLSFTAVAKDFQIKGLDWIFFQENQSEEVKIWRALRELVK